VLHSIKSKNYLWIHSDKAKALGIENGDTVEVSARGVTQRIAAKLTEQIHPDAAFMLHGFDDSVPLRSRSYRQSASDVKLQKGLLLTSDGGNCPLTECVVEVKKLTIRRPDLTTPEFSGDYYIHQDYAKCIGCQACEVHCKIQHQIIDGQARGVIQKNETTNSDNIFRMQFDFIHCFHCKKPLCAKGCSVGAIRIKNGLVTIDQARCVGCKECIDACPWQAPKLNITVGKAYKCDYCQDRINDAELSEHEQKPACVLGCATGALAWVKRVH
jgi:Fe-S-cluster-containing dehydrogenase component